jgi:hypothetical protein
VRVERGSHKKMFFRIGELLENQEFKLCLTTLF